MKTKILMLGATCFMTLRSFTVQAQHTNKNTVPEKKEIAGGQNKPTAEKRDSLAEYENFKTEQQINILKNEQNLGELKTKKINGNKDAQAEYDKIVLTLEQKNNALIDKLNNYTVTDKNGWEFFKTSFKNDMYEVTKLISKMIENKRG
jgi:hypothetical protein